MSNMTRTDAVCSRVSRLALAGIGVLALAGCGNAAQGGAETATAPDQPMVAAAAAQSDAPKYTGSPAQPLPDAGPVSPSSRVISKEEMAQKFPGQGKGPGCFITFAYAGYAPETLIWNDEPCGALTTAFVTPADLNKDNDWDRLDATDQAKVMALPEQRVFYVGGEFTASIYPLDHNRLTFEIAVAD
jgi:hypothetical protein